MTVDDRALVDRFLDMMAAEAGASRHTLAAYRNDLERAAEALAAPLGEVGPAGVSTLGEQWRSLAPSTVARRSAAVARLAPPAPPAVPAVPAFFLLLATCRSLVVRRTPGRDVVGRWRLRSRRARS